jgi:hypothetical protein
MLSTPKETPEELPVWLRTRFPTVLVPESVRDIDPDELI